jgi:excisionase family DNA binding protein
MQETQEKVALLTTRQVQELFNVDRSTIYRMAEDGRIPAVKVGRQWRFPSERLDGLLGGAAVPSPLPDAVPPADRHIPLESALPADTAEALAELAADLFGVMAVVTDMAGNALTPVANPCGYFSAVYEGVYTADRCAEGWRRLGEEIDLEPRFLPSHLGFLCARSFIRLGSSLVGMVIVGGVAPEQWPPAEDELRAVAAETGVPLEAIRAHVDEVFWIDTPHQDWIVRNLSRVSDLISHLAESRSRLMTKLEKIAALAGADNR